MKEKINIQKSKKSNPKMTYFSVLINDELVRDFLPTREMAVACAQYVSRTQNINIINDFTEIDCPNCADQASIAAPGQTVLCKTHEKTREYLDDDTSHLSQWSAKLEEIRESSLDDLGFLESVKKTFTDDEFRALNDHEQRLVVQAWLYPTIDDDVEEENVEQWYLENAHRMEFHSFAPYCSICGLESHYVGVTTGGIPFEFCKSCRDKLVRYKATLEPQKERIGA